MSGNKKGRKAAPKCGFPAFYSTGLAIPEDVSACRNYDRLEKAGD
jgi:hypothetical protein